MHVLVCINEKANYQAVQIILCHFGQEINICVPKTAWQDSHQVVHSFGITFNGWGYDFLRRHAKKVIYESPLRFSKESSHPGGGWETPCPPVLPDASSWASPLCGHLSGACSRIHFRRSLGRRPGCLWCTQSGLVDQKHGVLETGKSRHRVRTNSRISSRAGMPN